jgi:KUP system potassium uptake protein
VQLGYCPRVRIIHTSKEAIGQIYIPQVNWALLIMTFWLVLEFRSSSALAAAYGIAVSATMVVTTLLSISVAKNRWKWKPLYWGSLLVLFLTIDSVFLWANLTKIADGGWFPLLVGAVVFTLMTTWHKGRQILRLRLKEKSIPFDNFLKQIQTEGKEPARIDGTAVFMTGEDSGTPPALLHNVKHNRVLHSLNILMTIQTVDAPAVPIDDRLLIDKLGQRFYRVVARYGFSESPSIHEILATCRLKDLPLELAEMTFFLGRETILATKRPGMAIWREKLFSFMSKNAERATAYFDIPPDQVVEMGLQVEL